MIQTIRWNDVRYPGRLKNFERMPRELYLRGALPDERMPAVAIVGARRCTAYGREEARRFARVLAHHGVAVISGLAYGVDAAAHEGALEGGGETLAVLGCGVDRCYPPSNRALFDRILAARGGVISEFPPGTPALAHHFPIRNRIISAMADIVLVVEARRRSGSLITADYALEQGRTIFAVPGRIGDALSAGCNDLIAQGAGVACAPESILAELGIPAGETKGAGRDAEMLPAVLQEDAAARRIYEVLGVEPKSVTQLTGEVRLPPQEVTAALMRLVLAKRACERTRGFFSRLDV